MLIVPNAESALNEEAGKLLLEEYDQYFQRAKMITDIHAKVYFSKLLNLIIYVVQFRYYYIFIFCYIRQIIFTTLFLNYWY